MSNEETTPDAITVTENAVHVGAPGRPFLILRADGRVQFSDRVKPDSGAVRFLATLERHWPSTLKRLEKATAPDLVVPPGEPELHPHTQSEGHVSIDEVPPSPTNAAPVGDGVQVEEEPAGEEITLAEEPSTTEAEAEIETDARNADDAAAEEVHSDGVAEAAAQPDAEGADLDKLTPAEEARVEAAIELSVEQESEKQDATDLV